MLSAFHEEERRRADSVPTRQPRAKSTAPVPDVSHVDEWADLIEADLRKGANSEDIHKQFYGDERDFQRANRKAHRRLTQDARGRRRSDILFPVGGQDAILHARASGGPSLCLRQQGLGKLISLGARGRAPEDISVCKNSAEATAGEGEAAPGSDAKTPTKTAAYAVRHTHGLLYAGQYIGADALLCAMQGKSQGDAVDIEIRTILTWKSSIGRDAEMVALAAFSDCATTIPPLLAAAILLCETIRKADEPTQEMFRVFCQQMRQKKPSDGCVRAAKRRLTDIKEEMEANKLAKREARSRAKHIETTHILVEAWNAFATGRAFRNPEIGNRPPYGTPSVSLPPQTGRI